MKHIDLNLLLLFQALMQQRHVGRAAEKMGMSQPAFSNALSRLRQQLNDPLFIRTSRGMEPTEMAQRIYDSVASGLATIEQGIAPAKVFDPLKSDRTFTILAADYYEFLLLAPVIERLHTEAPNISLNVIRGTDIRFQDLESGKIDFVLDRFSKPPSDAFFEQTLWSDEFVVVCRKDHSIKVEPDGQVTLKEYLTHEHVQVTLTGVGKGDTDRQLGTTGQNRQIRVFTRQSAIMPILYALETNLLAVVTKKVALKLQKHLSFKMFEPPVPMDPFVNSLVWSGLSQHSAAHKWMRKLLRTEAQNID